MDYLSCPFEIKAHHEDTGIITGLASTFGNVDRQGDVVLPGCFEKTLKDRAGRPLPMLWSHRSDEPIGTWTSLAETQTGLEVIGKFSLEVQRAREIFSLVKDGCIQHLSIGYIPTKHRMKSDTDVRELIAVELVEVSPCVVPANPRAVINGAKSVGMEELQEAFRGVKNALELEKVIHRVVLLSRGESEKIVRAVISQPDFISDESGEDLRREIAQLRSQLQEKSKVEAPPPETERAKLRRLFKESQEREEKQREFIDKRMGDGFRRKAEQAINRKDFEGRVVSVEEQLEEWKQLWQQHYDMHYSMSGSKQRSEEYANAHIRPHERDLFKPYKEFDDRAFKNAIWGIVAKETDAVMARVKECKDADDLAELLDGSYQWKEEDIEWFKAITYGTKVQLYGT